MNANIVRVAKNVVVVVSMTAPAVVMRAQDKPAVPEWAQPASATHTQVSPPADFHRAPKTEMTKIGIFDGQTDVGAAVVPGSSSYDPATKAYTVNSAGYNVLEGREEGFYLWKK